MATGYIRTLQARSSLRCPTWTPHFTVSCWAPNSGKQDRSYEYFRLITRNHGYFRRQIRDAALVDWKNKDAVRQIYSAFANGAGFSI